MDPLFIQYSNSRDIETRNLIIQKYMNLVHYVIQKRCRSLIGRTYDYGDLLSYGYLGLIQAVENFDVNLGYKFSTYAVQRIYGSIVDEIRKDDWVPRSVRKKLKDIQRDLACAQKFGYDVDLRTLCNHYNLSETEYAIMCGQEFVSYYDNRLCAT